MRKMKISMISFLVLCPLLGGCSTQPFRMVTAESNSLQSRTDIPRIDPNNGPYLVENNQKDNSFPYLSWQIKDSIKQDVPFRIKYNRSYYNIAKLIAVEGRIGNKKKKYPVMLDTGSAQPNIVNDIHVYENKLAIYQFSENYGGWGMCYLPELQIGNTSLVNFPTIYHGIHMDVELFGIRIKRDKTIIVGLPTLLKFKYIVFDGTKKEVEFSLNKTVAPENLNLWSQYPLRIDNNLTNEGPALLVEIPISNEKIELRLDTGYSGGLLITQGIWERIQKNIQEVELKDGKVWFPAHGGPMDSNQGIIPKLTIGKRVVDNAFISVMPNKNSVLRGEVGLLGMEYFHDTVIVLDFEKKLMWVKE